MRARSDSANLDLLRAIAVSLVLVFHLLLFFGKTALGSFDLRPMGMLGVLLFFVHTSLVLMFSLERQQTKIEGAKLFFSFMLRRCARVYPLSLLVVTMIYRFRLPLGHLVPGALQWIEVGRFGFVSNLLLVQNLTEKESILGPLWSLPYEMQMYVFLPLLFLLAQRVRSIKPLVGVWALSVAVALLHARFGHMPDLVRFVPCFLPGIIAYKAWISGKPRLKFFGWPLVLAVLIPTYILFTAKFEKGWLTCLVAGLAVPQFAEMSSRWLRRASHLVAKYSYGIYLVHYFCIWLAFMKFDRLPLVGQWVVFAASLVVLPVLLYHTVEAPLLAWGNRLVDRLFAPRALRAPAVKLAEPAS